MSRGGVVGALTALLLGCSSTGGVGNAAGLPLRVVYQGLQCGIDRPSVHWSGDRAALDKVLRGASGPLSADVDFTAEAAVTVALGSRPTAGFVLSLERREARVVDGTAIVSVRRREPPPGSLQAQMVTTPCIVVALPRAGYREVAAVDQDGRVLGRTGRN